MWLTISALLLFQLAQSNPICPDGYIFEKNFNKCYKFVNESQDWISAEEYCIFFGGHLAAVHNAFENTYLASMRQPNQNLWIGMNLLMKRGASWTNGDKVDYTYWPSGFAPEWPDYLPCYGISDIGWQKALCDLKQPFVCQTLPYSYSDACQSSQLITTSGKATDK